MFKVLDIFSGIGGFSLGLEKTKGFETVAFCEIDPYCRQLLSERWPKRTNFRDISKINVHNTYPYESNSQVLMDQDYIDDVDGVPPYGGFYHGEIDVICGGFPCQDISIGGNQEGLKGEKSSLWFEYKRLIDEIRPKYAIIENVENLRKNGLDQVLRDIAQMGYIAEWAVIPASWVGARHKRERIWIVAYPSSLRLNGCSGEEGHLQSNQEHDSEEIHPQGPQCISKFGQISQIFTHRFLDNLRGAYTSKWEFEPSVDRVVNGISSGLDSIKGRDGIKARIRATEKKLEQLRKQRIKQLGNSIVPQIAELIARRILEIENGKN